MVLQEKYDILQQKYLELEQWCSQEKQQGQIVPQELSLPQMARAVESLEEPKNVSNDSKQS